MKITSYWTQSLVFNGNTPNQYSLLSQTFPYHLKLRPYDRQAVQHISWSQGHSTSLYCRLSLPVWTMPDRKIIYSSYILKYRSENLIIFTAAYTLDSQLL